MSIWEVALAAGVAVYLSAVIMVVVNLHRIMEELDALHDWEDDDE